MSPMQRHYFLVIAFCLGAAMAHANPDAGNVPLRADPLAADAAACTCATRRPAVVFTWRTPIPVMTAFPPHGRRCRMPGFEA